MSWYFTVIIALILVIHGGAHAQKQATTEPSGEGLFADLSTMAEDLQNRISILEASIRDASDSIEKGRQTFDAMRAAVTAVHGRIADDSQIWKDLGALLTLWEKRRQEALDEAKSNPRYQELATAWGDRIKAANELRLKIVDQRGESLALLNKLEADWKLFKAYYDLKLGDKVLEGMRQLSGQLSEFNGNMQKIVERARLVASTPKVPNP